jgi:outer membrane murein-binding lipoprotein Lpp
MKHRAFFTLIAMVLASLVAGCSSGPSRVATENDRLRAQVVDLEDEVRALKGRNAELEAQLRQASSAPGTASEEAIAATPRLVVITLGRLSHASDDNADGRYESIVVYVDPKDGLGRFMQLVGSVSMHAAVLPADGPAQTIGQATFGPQALRDAYRSAFGGPSYTLTLPIDYPPGATECTVRVVFTDAYTGEEFSAERAVELK